MDLKITEFLLVIYSVLLIGEIITYA